MKRLCIDLEECSQREIKNSEYHSDYKPYNAANQEQFHFGTRDTNGVANQSSFLPGNVTSGRILRESGKTSLVQSDCFFSEEEIATKVGSSRRFGPC